MIYQLDTTRKVITLKGTYPIKEVLKEIKKIDGWEEYSLEQEVQTYNPYFIPTVPCHWENIPFITYDTNNFSTGASGAAYTFDNGDTITLRAVTKN